MAPKKRQNNIYNIFLTHFKSLSNSITSNAQDGLIKSKPYF
ncbi:hypothetical protein ADICYQ_2858 [Cyclobacterium qasimii M12-11B]|uniref:Uncharacterized protein n=1 Tax=Cyclobacterium qasimii M12-11B TaxID=641524 RepID=S7WVP5_9BACT|nr:hypothetical protein ADICYQ_2858 [Cyclobacterium qasimii M12-11B]